MPVVFGRFAQNCVGFDPSGAFPGHLGLRSMRERVERLGGTLDIESAVGEGTRVRATIRIDLATGRAAQP